jgi:nucleotide-binding universal stress UspA family protein
MSQLTKKTAEWMTSEEITSLTLPIKKILLATDGSVAAIEATKFAVGLAKKFGAEILAVYVTGNEDDFTLPAELNKQQFFGGVHPSEAGLAVAKAFGQKNSVVVNTTILRGSVPRNILKAAQAEGVDIIVMGESGRSGLSRITLGSVAESVIRLSPYPVLVIRRDGSGYK